MSAVPANGSELTQADAATYERELQAQVERFQVRFEVAPEYAYVNDERRSVGWTIELSASHESGPHYPTPGCPMCAPVEHALAAIVAAVVPKDPREAYCETHVASARHSLSHTHALRPEMTATISIVHRESATAPIDECETRCLHDIVAKLRSLHAREGK